MSLPPLSDPQYASNHSADALPVLGLRCQPLSPCPRDGIKLGFAIVIRCPPSAGNPPSLHQPHQRRINRSLIDLQSLFADLLDSSRDSVAVQWPHRGQRLQHHQIQCPLQNLRSPLRHASSCGATTGVFQPSCGMSTGNARASTCLDSFHSNFFRLPPAETAHKPAFTAWQPSRIAITYSFVPNCFLSRCWRGDFLTQQFFHVKWRAMRPRRSVLLVICLFVGICLFFTAGRAIAHAILLESTPAANSSVVGPNVPIK